MSDSDHGPSGSGDGVTRTRVRRSRPSGRSESSRRASGGQARRTKPLFWIGVGLIGAGVAILLWVAWEFWGTNIISQHRQQEVSSQLQKGWSSGESTVHTKFGDATAILHVPRFGKNYAVPVLEGDSDNVLASGIGHMPHTQGPGQVGNYALAGHRVTHGEPFAQFPSLRKGDEVYVETRNKTYIYVLDNSGTSLIVPFTQTWIIHKSPVNPDKGGVEPIASSRRLITLFSCSEIFHTDNRSVVFGHLVQVKPRAHGSGPAVPTAQAPAPSGGTPIWWLVAGAVVVLAALGWIVQRVRRRA
ncbi:MAG: class E sortase [Nocardioidaceae bacterium]|nr:class E sortase [Nocardioidaceae bacterium]MCL2614517.1 class E sortase [Nocardioidaceae bacterium]